MLFPGRIYIARGSWYFGDFRYLFLPNIGEDQKCRTIWARGPSAVPYGKSSPGYRITFIKRLDESPRKQRSGQSPLILPGLYISIGWQNRIDEARAYWLLILM